jgi:hypothetical protein
VLAQDIVEDRVEGGHQPVPVCEDGHLCDGTGLASGAAPHPSDAQVVQQRREQSNRRPPKRRQLEVGWAPPPSA